MMRGYMSSILFGDTMVINIEQDYLLLGIVTYTKSLILLGSTSQKHYLHGDYAPRP